NVHLNTRQKWLALRPRGRASSRMRIFLDRLASTCATTLPPCHIRRLPRATGVSALDSTGVLRGPTLGLPRRRATACAMCAFVASRSPSRALHAASMSCAATTDNSCVNASGIGVSDETAEEELNSGVATELLMARSKPKRPVGRTIIAPTPSPQHPAKGACEMPEW